MHREICSVSCISAAGRFSCHLSQGCSKLLMGATGAAVVITLITICAVYYSSKSTIGPDLCVLVSVSARVGC